MQLKLYGGMDLLVILGGRQKVLSFCQCSMLVFGILKGMSIYIPLLIKNPIAAVNSEIGRADAMQNTFFTLKSKNTSNYKCNVTKY